jgi:hypothetical protein
MLLPQAGHLRLADFLEENQEAIISVWGDLATVNGPGKVADCQGLRDAGSGLLMAIAACIKDLPSEVPVWKEWRWKAPRYVAEMA